MFDRFGLLVIGRDHHDLGLENIANLVADQVVNGLNIEVLGQPQLDAADDLSSASRWASRL